MQHSFVEYIPEKIKENVLYISLENEIIVHNCCCGCGEKVFLPISPADWKLTFNGESITIFPSIGNWGMSCKSHYWIEENSVIWASKWSKEKIEECQEFERRDRKIFYGQEQSRIHIWLSKVKETIGQFF